MFSAGLLPYRQSSGGLEVLIAHPGGPLWAHRNEGSWSVVKGLVERGEVPFDAARREFAEETGWDPPEGVPPLHLGHVFQRSGKRVEVWAVPADYDPATLAGDAVTMMWRGRAITFPEIDEVRWADPDTARLLLNPAQAEFIGRLESELA
jgi:predicted NUDIX family NTP pyrophosphohydrolase